MSSVLCIELAAEVDQLLDAANPNNIEQNGKYIKYLFNYMLLYFWLLCILVILLIVASVHVANWTFT